MTILCENKKCIITCCISLVYIESPLRELFSLYVSHISTRIVRYMWTVAFWENFEISHAYAINFPCVYDEICSIAITPQRYTAHIRIRNSCCVRCDACAFEIEKTKIKTYDIIVELRTTFVISEKKKRALDSIMHIIIKRWWLRLLYHSYVRQKHTYKLRSRAQVYSQKKKIIRDEDNCQCKRVKEREKRKKAS